MTENQFYEYLYQQEQRSKDMNEWQPIETSPEDIVILLYCPDGRSSGIFTGIRGPGREPQFESNSFIACCDWSGAQSLEPTHWMPIPEPPTE